MTELALGIDLGTTNSCVAVMRDGRCEIVPFAGGARTVPSMIWVDEQGTTLVGHAAKQKFLTHPKNTIYGAKRLMGRRLNSQEMADIRQRFFYEIGQNDHGEPLVKAGNRYLDLIDVAAIILQHCKDTAREYLKKSVDSAVISVPAYFTQRQRQAVKQAGEKAGLDVLRIVNEPTAAALAYGVMHRENQRILVYDLGGGTFDVTVLEIKNQTYEVLATGGDSFLGGIDFDNQLVNYFASLIKKRNNADVMSDYSALQRLRSAAESAKIDLSSTSAAQVTVPFLLPDDGSGKPLDFSHRVTRDMFEEMVRPLVLKTLKLMNKVLQDANLQREQIDELVFVGGMTRMPLVEQVITKHFGKKPRKDVHPDEVVAQGAAILANGIANQVSNIKLVDVLPVSIGIAVDTNPYVTLVPNNTPVPYEVSRKFKTSRDQQTGATIRVFQGESDQADQNEYLGALHVAGFPPRAAGQVEFTVNLSLDQDSILLVTASAANGKSFFSQFLTERMVEKEAFIAQHKATSDSSSMASEGTAKAAIKDTIRAALQKQHQETSPTLASTATASVMASKQQAPSVVTPPKPLVTATKAAQTIEDIADIDTADVLPSELVEPSTPPVEAAPPSVALNNNSAKTASTAATHVPATSLFGSRKSAVAKPPAEPNPKGASYQKASPTHASASAGEVDLTHKPIAKAAPATVAPTAAAVNNDLLNDLDALVAEAEATYTELVEDDFVDQPKAYAQATSNIPASAKASKASTTGSLKPSVAPAEQAPTAHQQPAADDDYLEPEELEPVAKQADLGADNINFGALEEFLQEATQAKDIDQFLDVSAEQVKAKTAATSPAPKKKKFGFWGSD